jgi:hypothetical protein
MVEPVGLRWDKAKGNNPNEKPKEKPKDKPEKPPFYPVVEAWKHPVDLKDELPEIIEMFDRYIVLPKYGSTLLAFWGVGTHVINSFKRFPRLAITSPETECGKSLVYDVLMSILEKPERTVSLTPASYYRVTELYHPTWLVDEFDLAQSKEGASLLYEVLDAGHERNGSVIRMDKEGDPERFNCYGALAFALIGNLKKSQVRNRCLPLKMERKLPTEHIPEWDEEEPEIAQKTLIIRQKLKRWAQDNAHKLKVLKPQFPAKLNNRKQNNWKPLLSIATLMGGDWYVKVLKALSSLDITNENDKQNNNFIYHLKTIYEGHDYLLTKTNYGNHDSICSLLNENEEWNYSSYTNRSGEVTGIIAKDIAQKLKKYEIYSSDQISEEGNRRGYRRKTLQPVFDRYGNPPEIPVNPLEIAENSQILDDAPVSDSEQITQINLQNPSTEAKNNSITGNGVVSGNNELGDSFPETASAVKPPTLTEKFMQNSLNQSKAKLRKT